MESRRVFAFVTFASAIILVGMAPSACSSKECTLLACASGATITTHPAVAPDALQGATFGICFNGNCSSGVLGGAADGGGAPSGDPSHVVLMGDIGIQTADISASGGGSLVTFQFGEDSSNAKTKVHQSDTYRVDIVGADGTNLVDGTRTVSYSKTSQPNGPDCDPTCHNATVDIAP